MSRILVKKLRNLFGGRGGGHQKITLDYRGEGGGGLGRPKEDYVIIEWPLINGVQCAEYKLILLAKIFVTVDLNSHCMDYSISSLLSENFLFSTKSGKGESFV